MEGTDAPNALKERREGALKNEGANYRSALKPPSALAIGNKHPDRVYRWISKSLLDKNGGFDRRGWQVLTAKNAKGETLVSPYSEYQPTSDFRVDDVIAAFMPRELGERRKAELKHANEIVKQHMKGLRSKASRDGAKITGSIQTQRDGVVEEY